MTSPPKTASTVPQIGYCTNVHAGTDCETIKLRLEEFAAPIASRRRDGGPLGIGLWLPFSATKQLSSNDEIDAFGKWMADRDLFPFTINGFPYDNFHLPVVKHRVYRPTWAESCRLDYTKHLAKILARWHRASGSQLASISTLPIGWPESDQVELTQAAGLNFRQLADELSVIERESGVRVVVAIEPEPGCMLDRCDQLVDFFDTQLPEKSHRRYIGVCHDICHSAVMFEDQGDALAAYAAAGILVGKIQVSSAIDVPLEQMNANQRKNAIDQLFDFAEDRYLHQTGCMAANGNFRLVEDLPQWLSSDAINHDKQIRIHFHVPVFLQRFGELRSTQDAIVQCVAAMRGNTSPEFTGHWEVETYAWTVMPPELRKTDLGADIERELQWFEGILESSAKEQQ